MINLVKKQDKYTHVVMLINSSPNAKDEMWPGQFNKEAENDDKYVGAVQSFRTFLNNRS